MLCGLAITIEIMSLLCGAPQTIAFWTFVGTGVTFVALRFLFGKGSAMDMFVTPHLTAILLLLLWHSYHRQNERRRELLRPSRTMQQTGTFRSARLL